MKRRFLKSTLVVAAIALAGMGAVKTYANGNDATDLLTQNVEALSQGESGQYEYPNGLTIPYLCGGDIDQGNGLHYPCTKQCFQCVGGGSGCTPLKCSLHS